MKRVVSRLCCVIQKQRYDVTHINTSLLREVLAIDRDFACVEVGNYPTGRNYQDEKYPVT